MKSVRCWDDLSQYGVVPLTGEACGLMYRILFDITAQGKAILEKAFGVAELGLHENWNGGTADNPHIGSIMLAHEMLPVVSIFALLDTDCQEVWLTKDNGVYGIEKTDSPEAVDQFKQLHADKLVRRFAYAGTAGDRNVHAMSGRVQ